MKMDVQLRCRSTMYNIQTIKRKKKIIFYFLLLEIFFLRNWFVYSCRENVRIPMGILKVNT